LSSIRCYIVVGADALVCPLDCRDYHVKLTNIGKTVEKFLHNIDTVYENASLVSHVIMPDHVHFIVDLQERQTNQQESWQTNQQILGQTRASAPTTIPKIVQSLKGLVTKELGFPAWQRNYYERVIRSEKELFQMMEYIENNPSNWQNDSEYVALQGAIMRPYDKTPCLW